MSRKGGKGCPEGAKIMPRGGGNRSGGRRTVYFFPPWLILVVRPCMYMLSPVNLVTVRSTKELRRSTLIREAVTGRVVRHPKTET